MKEQIISERSGIGGSNMNICVAFSANWSKFVEVEIFAILKNSTMPTKIYLLTDDIEWSQMQKFKAITDYFNAGHEIIHLNAQSLYNDKITSTINIESRYTKYTLYRLLIPLLIEEEKILYIDADALVNKNLDEIYNDFDMEKYLIAGARDIYILPHYLNQIDFSSDDIYVNAGVLVINLKGIRELNLHEKWLEEVNNNFYPFHDQDIINKTCKNRVNVIDMKYNVSLSTGLNINADDIVVCHYAGTKNDTDWVKNLPFNEIWKKWEDDYVGIFRS